MAGQKDYAARMMQIEKQRKEYYKSLGTPPGVPTMKGAMADPPTTPVVVITTLSGIWATTPCLKVGCNGRSSMKREMLPARPFNGRSPKTRIMPSRDMVMSLPTPPTPRKSSSIIVTTSSAPLILPMPKPISSSSMLICPMASCL